MDNTTLYIVLGVGAFLAISAILFSGGSSKQTRRRIERIKNHSKNPSLSTTQALSLRRQKEDEKKGLIYWLSKPLPSIKKLEDMLERAGKKTNARQYLFMRLFFVAVIASLAMATGKFHWLVALAVGFVVGLWIPLQLLKRKIFKQNKVFLERFPQAIDLIVRGLRSGLPVSESIVLVSREVPEPVGGVFGTIANTMKLGVPMEKALQDMAEELSISEFNFFTTSIVLQRETGGNLAEILNNLSEVLRGRFMMHMKIRAMSSEARASTYIVAALPVFVFGAVSIISPDYMSPLFTDYRGNIGGGIAFTMWTFGIWVMNRMAIFEI